MMLDAHPTIFRFWASRRPIFRGPFFRGPIFRGQFFPGAIWLGTIFPRTIFSEDHFSGTIFPGIIFPGTIFPVLLPRTLRHRNWLYSEFQESESQEAVLQCNNNYSWIFLFKEFMVVTFKWIDNDAQCQIDNCDHYQFQKNLQIGGFNFLPWFVPFLWGDEAKSVVSTEREITRSKQW